MDPNAKAELFAFNASYQFCEIYPLSDNASNWQHYLAWLDLLGAKMEQLDENELIFKHALALGTRFLTHGAHVNTSIPTCVKLEKYHGQHTRVKYMDGWCLVTEQSAAHVLNKFTLRARSFNRALNQHLEMNGAVKTFTAQELWEMRVDNGVLEAPKRVLRHFTDEQQQKISSLAIPYLERLSTEGRFLPRETLHDLNEVFREVWATNSERVARVDARPKCWNFLFPWRD